jgi:hypothetical protein
MQRSQVTSARTLLCAAGLAVALAAGAYAGDTTVHAALPDGRPNDELLAKLATDEIRFQDYEQAVLVLGLKDDQEKAFREKTKARNEKMAELDKTDEATKVAELRAQLKEAKGQAKDQTKDQAKEQEKIDELNNKMKPLAEVYDKKRAALRAELLGALSPDQQCYWIQWTLFRDLAARFKAAALTGEQKDKLWKECGKPAQKLAKDGALATDPYLRGIKELRDELEATCAKKVLTSEQRDLVPKPGEKAAGKKKN